MRERSGVPVLLTAVSALMLALPAQAQAPAASTGWVVGKSKTGATTLSRKLDMLSVEYRAGTGSSASFLRVRVKPCDEDQPNWVQDDDVTPDGATLAEKTDSAAASIRDAIETAGLACTLADGLDEGIMDGFPAAFAQIQKGGK